MVLVALGSRALLMALVMDSPKEDAVEALHVKEVGAGGMGRGEAACTETAKMAMAETSNK